MKKTERPGALDQTTRRNQLWSETLAQYRTGPAHQFGPDLVELGTTDLISQMDNLAEVPVDIDIDDVWHQLVAEFLSIAAASGYPYSTPQALASRAARRVRSWLGCHISDADSI